MMSREHCYFFSVAYFDSRGLVPVHLSPFLIVVVVLGRLVVVLVSWPKMIIEPAS